MAGGASPWTPQPSTFPLPGACIQAGLQVLAPCHSHTSGHPEAQIHPDTDLALTLQCGRWSLCPCGPLSPWTLFGSIAELLDIPYTSSLFSMPRSCQPHCMEHCPLHFLPILSSTCFTQPISPSGTFHDPLAGSHAALMYIQDSLKLFSYMYHVS